MPHLDPLPWEASPQFRERFEHYQSTRGFVPNSILTMQRRPGIAQAFMDLNKAVLYEGTVAEELKMHPDHCREGRSRHLPKCGVDVARVA
jgi:hypothetical protein